MSYDDTIARMQMKDCPICLDMVYLDADGLEHILFDICEVHLKVTSQALKKEKNDLGGKK